MSLVHHGPDGRPAAIDLPDPGVAWVSAGPGGLILGTTLDGRALLGRSDGSDGWLAWRPLTPSTLRGSAMSHLTFGTLSADGAVAAFLDTDASSGPALLRIEIATGRTTALPLAGEPTGWPPVWLGTRLIVLRRVAGDRVALAVAEDAGLGPWSAAPLDWAGAGSHPDGFGGIGGSADGRAGAVLDRGFGSITILASAEDPLGSGAGPVGVPLEPLADGSILVSWIALSPTGDRLAVVRADALGDAARVEIHAATAGWREVAGWPLPAEVDRAVVAWAP